MGLVAICAFFAAFQLLSQQSPKKIDYQADIQPILAGKCQSCHQGVGAPSDLRMDTPDGLLKGGASGTVIVPGKPAESPLFTRITDRAGLRMPPSGDPLSQSEINLIQAWIEQGAPMPAPVAANEAFTHDVQPILASACYSCHSGTEARAQLNLSIKAMALKGSVNGPVIVPGDSKDSRLIHRLKGMDGQARMPLNGKPLTEEQIGAIARWIDDGARWPESAAVVKAAPRHWAYVKPVRSELPQVRDMAWVSNPIDRFVLARLEKEGLKPSPQAPKATLIRRLSLDLTGLPPAPAEVEAFVSDQRPDAYERLVDRLLASPSYGERWATPWLDAARYGDSEGWTTDRPRVAWPYRDWVVKALNSNMPFDQFAIQQVAGDLLPNPSKDQKIATGFVRSSMLLTEAGTDPEENNWQMEIDRASTIGTVFLGSTLGCAECHNHKYDPFTQKQFYQMVAFFNNSAYFNDPPDDRTGYDGNPFGEPKLDLPTPEQSKRRDEINAQIASQERILNGTSPEFEKRQAEWEQNVRSFEQQWSLLRPASATSENGTTLTVQEDGSVLASGKNPDKDTYVVDVHLPAGETTAIRIEALSDPSLPGHGPGRDYYGNFIVRDVTLEAGASSGQLAAVPLKKTLSDLPPPPVREDPRFQVKQLWTVDATRTIPKDLKGTGLPERPRIQLLLIPKQPFRTDGDALVRIRIVHLSDINQVNLGHFRLSATLAADPSVAVAVPAGLRPVLDLVPEKRTAKQAEKLTAHFRTVDPVLASTRDKIRALRDELEKLSVPSAMVMDENKAVMRPSAYIRMRGAFLSKGDLVQADVPSFLGPLPEGAPANRLGLAQWLVSRDNPLPARVTVNRFWEAIFGRGIVETSEDFGTQGSTPSHPELLDWLATEFMDSGWNMKAIQRLIVTSSTYRQSSAVTPELLDKDPSNMLLARGPRFRVEAEMVRDIALSASGLLSKKMYGPPVKPYQPDGLWGWFPGSRIGTDVWNVSPGEDKYRRGLYIFIRRSVRYPSLTVFDAPSREFCIARRPRSDTPLQALTTLNDPAFFDAARAMGQRIVREGGATVRSRAAYGFRLATSRLPDDRELDTLVAAFEKTHNRLSRDAKEVQELASGSDSDLAAWIMVSNGLLNLDEALTKE